MVLNGIDIEQYHPPVGGKGVLRDGKHFLDSRG